MTTDTDGYEIKEPTSSGTKEIHPPTRGVSSVCVDLIDEGLEPNHFQAGKLTPKVRLVFETERRKSNGRPFTVSRKFTASLHEKSSLRKFLMPWIPPSVWQGKINRQMVVGRPGMLAIVHEPIRGNEGEFYPKIVSAYPLEEVDKQYTPATGEHQYERFVKKADPNSPLPNVDDDPVPF